LKIVRKVENHKTAITREILGIMFCCAFQRQYSVREWQKKSEEREKKCSKRGEFGWGEIKNKKMNNRDEMKRD
jgi:hypothetical protein